MSNGSATKKMMIPIAINALPTCFRFVCASASLERTKGTTIPTMRTRRPSRIKAGVPLLTSLNSTFVRVFFGKWSDVDHGALIKCPRRPCFNSNSDRLHSVCNVHAALQLPNVSFQELSCAQHPSAVPTGRRPQHHLALPQMADSLREGGACKPL